MNEATMAKPNPYRLNHSLVFLKFNFIIGVVSVG